MLRGALFTLLFSVLLASSNVSAKPTTKPLRGVAIGGWLIIEPWIRPTLFAGTPSEVIDEWTFGAQANRTAATAALEEHWSTFVGEDDFKAIAAAGLDHVRIPIGYWAFEVGPGEPFIQGQLPYLKKAIKWAEKYGLHLIVVLYGAPGSQNGFINSGHILPFPGWQDNATNFERTVSVFTEMTNLLASYPHVTSVIGNLNEPAGYFTADILNDTQRYDLTTYDSVRYPNNATSPSDITLLIHDAYENSSFWGSFMTPPTYQKVALDTHLYQAFFQDDLSRTHAEHIAKACAQADILAAYDLPVLVGEWCPATTDCAAGINGRGTGACYDGSLNSTCAETAQGSCTGVSGFASTFSDDYKVFLRQFWEAQVQAYEERLGWTMWTWKTEAGAGEEWSYSKGLEYGWIPQDPTERKYPDICSNTTVVARN